MITVACYGGTQFYMGDRTKRQGNTYLDNVKAYIAVGGKHGFVNLPGNPKSIPIDNSDFWYEIESGEVYELYQKHMLNQEAVIVTSEPRILHA